MKIVNNSQTIKYSHKRSCRSKKKVLQNVDGNNPVRHFTTLSKRIAVIELFLVLDQMHGTVIIVLMHVYFIFIRGLRGLTKASGATA